MRHRTAIDVHRPIHAGVERIHVARDFAVRRPQHRPVPHAHRHARIRDAILQDQRVRHVHIGPVQNLERIAIPQRCAATDIDEGLRLQNRAKVSTVEGATDDLRAVRRRSKPRARRPDRIRHVLEGHVLRAKSRAPLKLQSITRVGDVRVFHHNVHHRAVLIAEGQKPAPRQLLEVARLDRQAPRPVMLHRRLKVHRRHAIQRSRGPRPEFHDVEPARNAQVVDRHCQAASHADALNRRAIHRHLRTVSIDRHVAGDVQRARVGRPRRQVHRIPHGAVIHRLQRHCLRHASQQHHHRDGHQALHDPLLRMSSPAGDETHHFPSKQNRFSLRIPPTFSSIQTPR